MSDGRSDDRGEVPLLGGNTTVVVRVGDTVRRVMRPGRHAVHQLLHHLEEVGFDGAPRFLGIDERGREVLSFLPGDVAGPDHPWDERFWRDASLVAFGRFLRRYHGAVDGLTPPGTVWCHNDAAPYNIVLQGTTLVGLIDRDLAAPGPPEWDLAFAAWQWVPLHNRDLTARLGAPPASERERRLELLLDAYGLDDRTAFMDTIRARIASSLHGIMTNAEAGDPVFVRLRDEGHGDQMARTLHELDLP